MTKIITLLGGFQVYNHGRALTGFQSDKARALLAYLAVEADRAHQRAQLAGLFWPEWPEQTALTYLRHALANLRRVFGEDDLQAPLLFVNRTTLRFNRHAAYQLDIAPILQANATLITPMPGIPLLQAAVDAYTYPFLDGFYLNGCAAFEEWLLLTRERLQRQIVDALCHLADHFEAQGNYQQACRYAQRRVELEPWLEEAHRQIMRLYALRGQRSAALAQYDHCRRHLFTALGVEPSAETVKLYEMIRTYQVHGGSRLQDAKVSVLQAPQAATTLKQNLPAPMTTLLGRSAELMTLQGLLQRDEVRLVTLTGPGGVGKTRLALATVYQLLQDFADDIFVVFLAAIHEAALVISAIAQTLGVHDGGARSLLEEVKAALHERKLLLLLDNFEQVAAAAPVLAELLAACPGLKIVVTSRGRLYLQGEFVYVTPPLALPAVATVVTLDDVKESAAVELFRQRAQAIQGDFTLTNANAPAVAAICTHLDGLPLAIELAASRIYLFAPAALLKRITERSGYSPLRFLKAERHDMHRRQWSLWDTIDWSYCLLSVAEQALFRQLAIFIGGASFDAVAAICSTELAEYLVDAMTSLVDKHLLQREIQANGEPRFVMLQTIREFALSHLAISGDLSTLEDRYVKFYLTFTENFAPRLLNADIIDCLPQMRTEYPNLRAALQSALLKRDVETCLRFCGPLLHYWSMDWFSESETYLQATLTLAAASPPSPIYINALATAGYMATMYGSDFIARRYFEQCLAMNAAIGGVGDCMQVNMACGLLAWIVFYTGDYPAAYAYFAEAERIAVAANDDWSLAMTFTNEGKMATRLGEFERAHQWHQTAVALHRRCGDLYSIALALRNLAHTYILQQQCEKAVPFLAEARHCAEQIQTEAMLISIDYCEAMVALAEGKFNQAATILATVVTFWHERKDRSALVNALETVVEVAVCQQRLGAALRLAGALAAYFTREGVVMPPVEQERFDRAVTTARSQVGYSDADSAWAKGMAMTLDDAVAYALNITITDMPLRLITL